MRKRVPVLKDGKVLRDENGNVLEFNAVNQEELDRKIDAPQTAQVGEVLTVEEVDDDGKPTKWKTAPGTDITTELTQDSTDKEVPSAKATYEAVRNATDKDAVRFVAQELTDAQKQQVRENIDAEKRIIILTNPKSLDVFNAVALGGIVIYREGTTTTPKNETFLFPYSNIFTGTGYVRYEGLAVGYEKGIVYQYNSENGIDGAKLKFTPKTEISLYEKLKYFTIGSDGLLQSQALAPKPTYTTVPIPNMDSDDGKILRAHEDKWKISDLVISDWAQNDETAEDYIKNRPGGYDVVDSTTISWDGSSTAGGFYYYTSGRFLVHVSDTILSKEELSNAKVYNNDDPDTELEVGSISEGNGYFADFTRGVVVVTALYAKPYGPTATLNKTGVFFNCQEFNNVRHYTSKLVIQNTKEVKIPAKYLDLEQSLSSKLPIPTTAQVGQIVHIKSVDESGKITETEAVDMPNGLPTPSPSDIGKCLAVVQTGEHEVGYDFNHLPNINDFVDLGIDSAIPGQILRVFGINDFGNPVAYEAVDIEDVIYDGVTVKSSTEGSTKKFKITVDDSGTISVTELV